MRQAPTMHDLFEQFKKRREGMNYTWTLWYRREWARHIDHYINLGLHLIAIQKGLKVPVANRHWDKEESLDKRRAIDYIEQGFNLAVVGGLSQPAVSILDYDSKEMTNQLILAADKTLTASTPNGFAFFLKGKMDRTDWENIKAKYPPFDTLRDAINYELVPLSKTCTQDKGGKEHNCAVHDYRVRTWLNDLRNPLDVEEFVKLV